MLSWKEFVETDNLNSKPLLTLLDEDYYWGSNYVTLTTPLVLRFPFPIEPVRVKSQVRNIDIAPTLLELAGLPVPDHFDGRSLLPLITGAEPEANRVNFAGLAFERDVIKGAHTRVGLGDPVQL